MRQKRIKYDKMLLRLKSSLGSVPGGKTQSSVMYHNSEGVNSGTTGGMALAL